MGPESLSLGAVSVMRAIL